jgi:hypothetical protein
MGNVQEDGGDVGNRHFGFFGVLLVLFGWGVSNGFEGGGSGILTFNPMQRMVPTSCCVRGARMRPMTAVSPVGEPASSTDVPL